MSARAQRLHDAPWQGVFHVTGGGSSLIAEMLGTAGASRTVLDVRIPYAATALADLLGAPPEQACSEATARAMAMSAFIKARNLGASQPFGFACTASLATDRTKRGEHRAHAAIQTESDTFHAFWTFSGDRIAEEQALVEALWAKLGQALDIDGIEGSVDIQRTRAEPAWRALLLGETPAQATAEHDGRLLLPGAFNPLHDGHRQMLSIAEQLTGLEGAYELSVANVDKPFLDYREIALRLAQFNRPVWLTRLPTFIEKARQFPGAIFVVGLDTLMRIAEPRYYGSPELRDAVLAELDNSGARYLVFGRELEGRFKVLSDLASELPESLLSRATEVDAARFRNPVSSTDIRQASSDSGQGQD
jgi:nicotinamide mononucleotide (NMN) deamidase PncC